MFKYRITLDINFYCLVNKIQFIFSVQNKGTFSLNFNLFCMVQDWHTINFILVNKVMGMFIKKFNPCEESNTEVGIAVLYFVDVKSICKSHD